MDEESVSSTGGTSVIMIDGDPLPVFKMDNILENPWQRLKNKIVKSAQTKLIRAYHLTKIESEKISGVVINVAGRRVVFIVDKLVDEQEVVVKSLGSQLPRVRNVTGATMLSNGKLAIILNPVDIMKSVQMTRSSFQLKKRETGPIKKRVLVVDDSITTRTLEKNILESAGYEVVTATNGKEGYAKLEEGSFDVVVSDVEMYCSCRLLNWLRKSIRLSPCFS